MASDFEVNQTKIKGGCRTGRKVLPHDSNSDLPLVKQLHHWRKPEKPTPTIFAMTFQT